MIQPQPEGLPEVADDGGSEESKDKYTVRLDRFEGPMDLLLYLIQRDEMDVYDIPIAHITQQYLEFIELIDVFNLDNAGEFLVMAATLMRIKARMLLPVQKAEDGEDDDVDPRDELVRRLLEYKKYKEAAESLAEKEEARRDYYARGVEFPYLDLDQEPPEFSLSLFDLLGAVRNVLNKIDEEPSHHVFQEVFTVQSESRRLVDLLTEAEQLRFDEVFEAHCVKMQVVVTFVAMLELLKRGGIQARQLGAYGEIWLSPVEGFDLDAQPAEMEEESP